MTTFRTFASGSTGNAALLSCGDTHLLIDMGISCRRVCQALAGLGLGPGDLSAVLITHEHTDHTAGLATYIKKNHTPILTTPGTARQLVCRLAGIEPLLRTAGLGSTVELGCVEAALLPTSHDCAESAAFRFATPDGTVGYLTDTGYIPRETGEALLGADLLVLDEAMSACTTGMIEEGRLLELLEGRPEGLEVVMTGRNPSAALAERADYLTEMKLVKHPFQQGVSAREGIEY